MDETIITKRPKDRRLTPNIDDYHGERSSFDWAAIDGEIGWLPAAASTSAGSASTGTPWRAAATASPCSG